MQILNKLIKKDFEDTYYFSDLDGCRLRMTGWTPVKEKDRVGVAIYNYLVSLKTLMNTYI